MFSTTLCAVTRQGVNTSINYNKDVSKAVYYGLVNVNVIISNPCTWEGYVNDKVIR